MRKAMMAVAAMLFMAGLVVAAEVTVVKYDKDKKELTVKDGDNEKTYKVSDKTKIFTTNKDGDKTEGKLADFETRMEAMAKFAKGGGGGKGKGKGGGNKLDITTDGDNVTEIKYRAFGKKQDKNQ
jgi:hypothetical protein